MLWFCEHFHLADHFSDLCRMSPVAIITVISTTLCLWPDMTPTWPPEGWGGGGCHSVIGSHFDEAGSEWIISWEKNTKSRRCVCYNFLFLFFFLYKKLFPCWRGNSNLNLPGHGLLPGNVQTAGCSTPQKVFSQRCFRRIWSQVNWLWYDFHSESK